jgi:methyl-accepting chemotaxis protein
MNLPKLDHQTILLAFSIVIGLAMLLQTIMLLAITLAVRKAAKVLREEVGSLRSALMPVIYDARDLLANTQGFITNMQEFFASAQGLITRVAPKVEAATADLAEIAHGLRTQTAGMQATATEIVEKARKQSDRMDEICTGFLDTVDRAGGFVAQAVGAPIRQISGVLGSVKAIIESLRSPARR